VPAAFRRLYRTGNPLRLARYAASQAGLAWALRGVVRRTGAALVHSNSTTAHVAAGLAAKLAGVPAVWHVRDLVDLGLMGHGLVRTADRIVAISHAVARGLDHYAGRDKVEVVHNGIDADAFAAQAAPGALRAELGLAPGARLVGMVAQMVPWKGQDVFLDMVQCLAAHVPDATAVVVGEDLFGDQADYVAGLHRQRDAMGLEGRVRFLGHRADVATVMADLDVLVVPSRNEPFGRVALEAMALATPVVASNSGGLPEIVADGVTGGLCPTGDGAAFARAVAELLTNPTRGRELGEAGSARVQDHFTAQGMAARVVQIYEELLDAHRH